MTSFNEIWWQILILIIGAYLLGNLSIAFLLARARKKDITKQGSGNPGTLNVYRNFGFLPGLITLLLDLFKGAVPTLVGWLIFKRYDFSPQLDWGIIAMFLAGFFVVLGHDYPALRKFKGGKGVASTLGVYFVATSVLGFWYVGVAVFILGLLYIYFFEWGAIGSLIMMTILPTFAIVYIAVKFQFSYWLLIVMILNGFLCALSFFKHRGNLKKLANGTENRTNLKNIFKKKKDKDKEQSKPVDAIEIKDADNKNFENKKEQSK